jgi:hypothetical protein
MRLTPAVLVLLTVAVLTGCGAEESSAPRPTPPAASHDGFADEPAPPEGPAPDGVMADGPPPAWIATSVGSRWLAYATYCWGRGCADYVAPRCGDPHVPDVHVQQGETVTFHLGFEPASATLAFFGKITEGTGGPEEVRLDPRTLAWTVDRGGPVWLSTQADEGDAAYAGCLRVEPADGSEALTVPEALARGDGPAAVTGTIHAEAGVVRLCDALAESYPPQCPGASLRVKGFALAPAGGLSRAGRVVWGDRPITLRGTLRGSALVVSE